MPRSGGPASKGPARVRVSLGAAIALALLVVGCEAPPPRTYPQAAQKKPRWQPVPAKADGTPVAGGRRHVIKRGETGLAIAQAYGVPWRVIAGANNIAPDAILYTGRSLFIPTGESRPRPATRTPPTTSARPSTPATPSAPLTIEERAAAFTIDVDDLITGSQPAAAPPQSANRTAPAGPPPAPVSSTAPRFVWPVRGRTILSTYGSKPGGRFNDGINIRATTGEPVRAAADGEVIYVGDAIASFGLLVIVRHAGGLTTVYGHLSDATVSRGKTVRQGETIAKAGQSGSVHEPQLLFEIRQGRKAVNPVGYLPA